jgi:GntR family transcriptional regulator
MVYGDTIHYLARMHISIQTDDRRPIYEQVADGIRARIAGRDLQAGDPLPSVRQLAADLGVNLNTIATAYRELQDDGLITIRHGSGAVVASGTAAGATSAELRRSLGAVLARLVLTGMRRREIMQLVGEELRELTGGTG